MTTLPRDYDRVTDAEFLVKTPRFAIGQKYTTLGKHPRDCVVIDVLTTTNAKGEVVRIRYVAEHTFMGGSVTDHDVLETTIARCLDYWAGREWR